MTMTAGIYRFTDQLSKFRIRIRLKRSNNPNWPWSESDLKAAGLEIPLTAGQRSGEETDEVVFGWQEKVFNSEELEWYQKRANCVTRLDNLYHERAVKMEAESNPRRLYSYVETDFKKDEINRTTELETNVHQLAQAISRISFKPKTPNLNQRCEECFKHSSAHQNMFIYCDLRPSLEFPAEEILLCSLHVDNCGVLTITPDFSSTNQPYYLKNSQLDNFEYKIEHASKMITEREREKEHKFYAEKIQKHKSYLKTSLPEDFEMPNDDTLKIYLYGDIDCATHFEDKNLFVFYSIYLPKGWSSDESSWLTGLTQTSKPSNGTTEDVVYFSFPFEGCLSFALKNLEFEERIEWPTILLEVSSKDYWGCVRTEGYGFVHLPSDPGIYQLNTVTWKPVSVTPTSKLRDFFLGGENQIEDLTYVSTPSTSLGKRLNRLGFQSETSGTVNLKLNIVHQSQSFLHQSKAKDLVSKLKSLSSQSAVHAVLAAFQKARQNMLDARSKLRHTHPTTTT